MTTIWNGLLSTSAMPLAPSACSAWSSRPRTRLSSAGALPMPIPMPVVTLTLRSPSISMVRSARARRALFSSAECIVSRSPLPSLPTACTKPVSRASTCALKRRFWAFCSISLRNTFSPLASSVVIEARALLSMPFWITTSPSTCKTMISARNSVAIRPSRLWKPNFMSRALAPRQANPHRRPAASWPAGNLRRSRPRPA